MITILRNILPAQSSLGTSPSHTGRKFSQCHFDPGLKESKFRLLVYNDSQGFDGSIPKDLEQNPEGFHLRSSFQFRVIYGIVYVTASDSQDVRISGSSNYSGCKEQLREETIKAVGLTPLQCIDGKDNFSSVQTLSAVRTSNNWDITTKSAFRPFRSNIDKPRPLVPELLLVIEAFIGIIF